MKKEARVRAQQELLARLDEERKARAAQAPKPQHRNLNQSVRANVDESKSKIKKAVVEAPDEHQSLDSSPGRWRNVATGASGSPGRRREVATAGSDVSEVSPVNNKDIERQRARGEGTGGWGEALRHFDFRCSMRYRCIIVACNFLSNRAENMFWEAVARY